MSDNACGAPFSFGTDHADPVWQQAFRGRRAENSPPIEETRPMSVTIIARDAELADEIVILTDGINRYKNYPSLTLTEADADRIIATFREHGTDIPFDFEHSTIVRGEKGQSAPACGWITDMRYEAGRGLVASVRWTDEGKSALEKKEYRYFSPVIDWNSKTGEMLSIHSVALTNKPRTVRQAALMAASMNTEPNMDDPEKKDAGPDLSRVSAQLKTWGAQLTEEASANQGTLLAVAMETLGRLYDAAKGTGAFSPDDIANQVAASQTLRTRLAASLNLDAKSDVEVIIGKVEAMSKDEGSMATKLATLSETVETLTKERNAAQADRLIASALDAGKILPGSDLEKWAKRFAASDSAGFTDWCNAAPVLCEPGRRVEAKADTVPADADKDRAGVIRTAMREYNAVPASKRLASTEAVVNVCLKNAGFGPATEDELKQFAAK